MKFLAMLRDSLRETLDAKVFYVMIALSLLVVLFAASVSYRPVTMQKRMEEQFWLVTEGTRGQMQGNGPKPKGMENIAEVKYEVENFNRRDDRAEPWLGDYQFDLVTLIKFKDTPEKKVDLKELQKARDAMPLLADTKQISRMLEGMFFQQATVEVLPAAEKQEPDTLEMRYRVTTTGTKAKTRQEWFHQPVLFFGALEVPTSMLTMSGIIDFISNWVVGAFGAAFTMLVSIVLTASFLPNMLNKGSVDLLITKPINRPTLFAYKFVGGLLFMLLNTSVVMIGLYVVLGVQAGVWLSSLLLLIPVYTFLFAILYSVSALCAVLTRNAIVCIMLTCLAWVLLFTIGWAHWLFIENQREDAPRPANPEYRAHWAYITSDALYQITPRYKEIDWLGNKMLQQELYRPTGELTEGQKKVYQEQLENLDKRYGRASWMRALPVSLGFIALMLALACWRFSVTDY